MINYQWPCPCPWSCPCPWLDMAMIVFMIFSRLFSSSRLSCLVISVSCLLVSAHKDRRFSWPDCDPACASQHHARRRCTACAQSKPRLVTTGCPWSATGPLPLRWAVFPNRPGEYRTQEGWMSWYGDTWIEYQNDQVKSNRRHNVCMSNMLCKGFHALNSWVEYVVSFVLKYLLIKPIEIGWGLESWT